MSDLRGWNENYLISFPSVLLIHKCGLYYSW